MKLYNTPSKTVEDIKPQTDQVTVYTCGPTVYDYPHIGNWFTFIRYDLLVRALKAEGLHPKWVMNITDVGHLVSDADEGEDKLEKGAKREGKTAWEVAEFYTANFLEGMQALNISQPEVLPKATDHIPEQIALVQQLEAKGFTYVIDDGVYFDVSKFPPYADFAHLNLAEQEEGSRVEANKQKRNPADFALWKFSPKDEKRDMEWDSPWGTGFPGWHLECSAMSMKYLGETIDVHAGGIDHIPVHHTNEIAQSEAATGKPFVKYWMHTNHILSEGQKISKSLGNGITLEDIDAKGYHGVDLRMLVLQSHYRSQAHFTWDNLQAAQNSLLSLMNNFSWIYQAGALADTVTEGVVERYLEDYKTKILGAFTNDLNTPQVIALLHECAMSFTTLPVAAEDIATVEAFDQFIQDTLGIPILVNIQLSEELTHLLEDRAAARTQKDWPQADALRDQLAQQGIGVRDTDLGQIWYRLKA